MSRQESALWRASSERLQSSQLWKFKELCELRTGQHFDDYKQFHQWSVAEASAFWSLAAEFLKIEWQVQPQVTYLAPPTGGMLGGRWFPDGKLSFTRNLLPIQEHDEIKIISIIEGLPAPIVLTAHQLKVQVARCTAALQRLGISPGDRIVGITPNSSEAIVAMLASAALGAIWSSCSPDFGVEAILDRFSQVQPVVLFASKGYSYNGRLIDCSKTAETVAGRLLGLKACVMIDPLDMGQVPSPFQTWVDFLGMESEAIVIQHFHPVATDFSHPLYILFSSGTTGRPKCIVHSVGGTLLQHKKEHVLHCNLGPGKRLLYFTTCGWMMWNWMASALASGTSLVLFEGAVNRENFSVLWQALADFDVTCFGTSPKFIASCMKAGVSPRNQFALPHLETVLSTGSPLMTEHFKWIYDELSPDIHLASICGGTDIVSCFMLGNLWKPVYLGEIQAPGLGMAVDCWDDAGHSVRGQKGELVCTQSFPSMPLGFWGDDGSKYREAYFSFYPNLEVWRHGDFIAMNEELGITVYGRSDATLNPGGVRIGTAEIYSQVEQLSEIVDSLAVSWQRDGDDAMILFVKLQAGVKLSQDLLERIRNRIKLNLSPRHIPAQILDVSDIPYTRSGKKLELAVTRILHHQPIDNVSAIGNPECLGEFEAWRKKLDQTEKAPPSTK